MCVCVCVRVRARACICHFITLISLLQFPNPIMSFNFSNWTFNKFIWRPIFYQTRIAWHDTAIRNNAC